MNLNSNKYGYSDEQIEKAKKDMRRDPDGSSYQVSYDPSFDYGQAILYLMETGVRPDAALKAYSSNLQPSPAMSVKPGSGATHQTNAKPLDWTRSLSNTNRFPLLASAMDSINIAKTVVKPSLQAISDYRTRRNIVDRENGDFEWNFIQGKVDMLPNVRNPIFVDLNSKRNKYQNGNAETREKFYQDHLTRVNKNAASINKLDNWIDKNLKVDDHFEGTPIEFAANVVGEVPKNIGGYTYGAITQHATPSYVNKFVDTYDQATQNGYEPQQAIDMGHSAGLWQLDHVTDAPGFGMAMGVAKKGIGHGIDAVKPYARGISNKVSGTLDDIGSYSNRKMKDFSNFLDNQYGKKTRKKVFGYIDDVGDEIEDFGEDAWKISRRMGNRVGNFFDDVGEDIDAITRSVRDNKYVNKLYHRLPNDFADRSRQFAKDTAVDAVETGVKDLLAYSLEDKGRGTHDDALNKTQNLPFQKDFIERTVIESRVDDEIEKWLKRKVSK